MKMNSIDQVKAKLKEIIVKNLDANIDLNDISDEASLYEDGIGLDSITIVNLIVQIERAFNFTFEHDEINSNLFKNINALGDFIASKLENAEIILSPFNPPTKKLSFCITCKNRFHQISETLPINLNHNASDADDVEFVLVDFDSQDGLKEWVINNFQNELESGYLKFLFTDALPNWNASIAKNTAHLYSTGSILVNLDCDNFTGKAGGAFVISKFDEIGQKLLLHQYSGNIKDGSFGRIAVAREYFFEIGGYDETFLFHGYQDFDLIERLKQYGLTYQLSDCKEYTKAIYNTKEEGIKFTNSNLTYQQMHEANKAISKKNIAEDKLVVNNGILGIRNNISLYDKNDFKAVSMSLLTT